MAHKVWWPRRYNLSAHKAACHRKVQDCLWASDSPPTTWVWGWSFLCDGGSGTHWDTLKQLDLVSNHMLASRRKVVLLGLVSKEDLFSGLRTLSACCLLPDSRPCGGSQACCGLPYTSTVTVLHGKITTPRVPLTASSWAKPAEDTGSDSARQSLCVPTDDGTALPTISSWSSRAWLRAQACDHSWVNCIAAF